MVDLLLLLIVIILIVVFVVTYIYTQNKFVSKYGELKDLEIQIHNMKREFSSLKNKLEKELETYKKEETIKVQEELLAKKQLVDNEIKELRLEQNQREERLNKKEESLDSRLLKFEEKSQELEQKMNFLKDKEKEIDEIKIEQEEMLSKISMLSKEEAKDIILTKLDNELISEKAHILKEYEYDINREKERISKEIIATAINKGASDYVANATISVVQLPSEEMKGRIIGKEGRNIKALEMATGVDLIIDDTPEAVLLSSFDGVRREIARISLEKLIEDGRIHPAKIEELVEKSTKEINNQIMEAAENAMMEVGIHTLPRKVLEVLGKLKYRTSFGQNVLQHSIEVAHIAGTLAYELGLDVDICKKAGLLHDIGKAFTHELEGSHALIGAEFLKKNGINNDKILNAVEAHHDEVEKKSIEAVIIQAADSISASRPGSRRETLSNYLKRLEQLETIANSYDGIENSYAIQAGRELRLIVKPDKISDEESIVLSRKIAKNIEDTMMYPGQIKVTVIRETRAVDIAK